MTKWFMLKWQSGLFGYQMSVVQIQSSTDHALLLTTIEKTKIKKTVVGNGTFLKIDKTIAYFVSMHPGDKTLAMLQSTTPSLKVYARMVASASGLTIRWLIGRTPRAQIHCAHCLHKVSPIVVIRTGVFQVKEIFILTSSSSFLMI